MLLPAYKGDLLGMKVEFLEHFFPMAVKELQGLAHGYWQAPAPLISKPVTERCVAVAVLKWKTFIISWKTVLSWRHSRRFSLLKLLKLVPRWDFTENQAAVPSATCAMKGRGGSLLPLRTGGSKCRTIWGTAREKLHELLVISWRKSHSVDIPPLQVHHCFRSSWAFPFESFSVFRLLY